MDKEKKQKLKRLWNKGVPVKEIAEKLGFKSGGNVYYWRKKLGLEPRQPQGYWNDPKNVDRAYDEFKEEHGRVTQEMFDENHSGALRAIKDGRYDPEIRTWNQYVKSRGDKPVRSTSLETKVNTVIKYFTGDQSQREIAREGKVSPFSVSVWSRSSTVLQRVINRLEVPDVFGEKGLRDIGIPNKKTVGMRNKKTSMFLDRLVNNGLYSPFKISDGMIYVRSDRLEEFKSLKKILGF